MRTPDEIKKGLELCYEEIDCSECPYLDNCFENDETPFGAVMPDALALIQRLQADNAKKDETIQMLQDGNACLMRMIDEECEKTVKLEAERDALMHYLHSMGCETCLYDDYDGSEPPCINCTATRDLWQFQGVQKEE